MKINRNYTTTNVNNTGARNRKGVKSDYRWIVVHYVGACDWNTGFESTAKNNCLYYRDSNVGASANFYVDSTDEVYQSVPWDSDRYAWHCGTGSSGKYKYLVYDPDGVYCCNPTSIGVEICTCKKNTASRSSSDNDWYFDPRTYSNAVEFIKYLMKEFNIDIDHVIRHYDVNSIHKACPSQMVGNDVKTYYNKTGEQLWKRFKADLTSTSKGLQASELKDLTEAQVVERVGSLFTEDQKKTGILASVSMAQFILESGYVHTELAQNANNCFGMKKSLSGNTWSGSTWDGVSIYIKKTNEQNPDGSIVVITADFRKYPCIEDSISDHGAYLLGAKNGDKLRYEGLKGCTDYKEAITIIKNGGYATDINYISKICSIIERWNLTQYDVKVEPTPKTYPAVPFMVRVIINDLNYRSEPSMNGVVKGQTGKGSFTIMEVKNDWGRLKSGAGWIYLGNPEYCTIIR